MEERMGLYSICQRYNFESNLQPRRLRIKYFFSCIRYVKDTILKAIYNISVYMLIYVIAVFDISIVKEVFSTQSFEIIFYKF